MPNHYFSLQFSAIQKTVLRHDRLWSIAGISNILSRLNEIQMPKIAETHHGQAIVAGGGKFTARFANQEDAEKARRECVKRVSTTLPMLEFQVSAVRKGTSFQALKGTNDRNIVIDELGEQKRRFRGYGVTFNPHLALCDECGEYPAEQPHWREENKRICRICHAASKESKKLSRKVSGDIQLTTVQRVYAEYLEKVNAPEKVDPAADFNDLFPKKNDGSDTDERKRIAVWFSDLNNMNDKVPVWLKQDEEHKVCTTFDRFRDTVVEIIVQALADTFKNPAGKFLPFRLVVAGGDDLCLVMAEKNILDFTSNISRAVCAKSEELKKNDPDHPLTVSGLRKLSGNPAYAPKPFGFGASFVVTSIHTPFSQIHQVGEELMSAAKKGTDRQGNSVNWRIMAEEEAVTETLLVFERPLFIEKGDQGKNSLTRLTFNDYVALLEDKDMQKISGSHRQQIVALMQQEKNPWKIERQLKLLDASEQAKSFHALLTNERFRVNGDIERDPLAIDRIATLFELMTIAGDDSK